MFFKFVEDCDINIIPGNEVLVTDSDANLFAVGHATVSGIEETMLMRHWKLLALQAYLITVPRIIHLTRIRGY